MKKLKQYNKKEIKALVIEYNALVNDMFQTDEAGLIYMFDREVIEDQNFVLPYMPIMKSGTKSGQPERMYLEWHGELAKVDADTINVNVHGDIGGEVYGNV